MNGTTYLEYSKLVVNHALFFGISLLEVIGMIGAVLLTVSAIPQLIKTIQTKDVSGLSLAMLWSWSVGCFAMLIYVIFNYSGIPLIVNYLLNTTVSGIILICYYKYK